MKSPKPPIRFNLVPQSMGGALTTRKPPKRPPPLRRPTKRAIRLGNNFLAPR